MKLAKRVSALKPSATMAISARAKALKKEGKDVLDFGLGEPDFQTPEHIIDATVDALKAGKTKYCPAGGTPEMKNAVLSYYKNTYNLDYALDEVIVNVGAKHSLYNIFQAAIDEGEEVILPAPFWVSYKAQILLAGGIPVIVETDDSTGFKMTVDMLKAKITDKTRMLVLNSPSNPTGAVYHEDELRAIAEVCVEKDIYVISDEVYENILYGRKHVCLATISDAIRKYTIIVNAVSKSYAMTGYRIGYILGDKDLVNAINKIQSHSTSNPVTFAMEGAIAALTGKQDGVTAMRDAFEVRRGIFVEGMNALPGVTCAMPEGAFYVFPNFKGVLGKEIKGKTYETTLDLCKGLLEDLLIACVPGEAFGAPGFIRFSYATSKDVIEAALTRLREWLL